jgi:hypothetical protein
MCMKHTGMSRCEKPLTLLFCSPQIPQDETEGESGITAHFNTRSCLSQPRTKRASRTMETLILKKLINFLNSLLLFCSWHVNGTISLILTPQYIMYWKRAYYIQVPISENISLLIKLQNGEEIWTNSSASFYRFHYFL